MQTQIQVRVNEEGALRNQRFAFSDRYTLITELLQNARRAGADRIEVAFDAATQVLRVTDNGRGIEDFQKLLVFNESGWDDAAVPNALAGAAAKGSAGALGCASGGRVSIGV